MVRDEIGGKRFPHRDFYSNMFTTEPVVSIDVSPDEKCIVASSLDGSLRLIDRKNGRELNW